MLENLQTIPWHTLEHAYGPASDTPHHLKNLASDDEETRLDAYDYLSITIVHQGSVYEAAIAAIPFFFELLQAEKVKDKQNILDLLYEIACGGSWDDKPNYITDLLSPKTEDYHQVQVAQKKWITNVRSSLAEYTDILLDFLQDDDEDFELFHNTVAVLSLLTDNIDERAYQTIVSLAESTQEVMHQADLILLLGHFGETKPKERLIEFFETSPAEIVKFAAAISFGLNEPELPHDIADYLSTVVVKNDPRLIQTYHALGAIDQYWFDIAKILILADPLYVDKCVATFINAVEEASFCIEEQLLAVLLMAFYRDGSIELANPNPIQQQAVYAVAKKAFPDPQRTYSNTVSVLRIFGLPTLREPMDQYLGLPAETDVGFDQPHQDAIARHRRWVRFWDYSVAWINRLKKNKA